MAGLKFASELPVEACARILSLVVEDVQVVGSAGVPTVIRETHRDPATQETMHWVPGH